jgi:3-hydroxyisobutyrate dehydrogenase-like beta-hydroxyacid dehydrogenase
MLGAGLPLGVHNRTAGRARELGAQGAQVIDSLEEALSGAGLVFTMLSDDPALEGVLNERTAKLLSRGATHVSFSTVSPAAILRTSWLLESVGAKSLSSPVMGRPEAAKAGKLRLLLSGPKAAKEVAAPYLAPLGEPFDFGEDPKSALLVKLGFNLMIASMIETLSEAFCLVEKGGVDPEAFFGLVSGTLFDAPAVKTYGGLILKGKFGDAGFSMALGAKDVGLVASEAESSKTPMPLAGLLKERFDKGLSLGWKDRDWCAISELQRENAGLPPRDPWEG